MVVVVVDVVVDVVGVVVLGSSLSCDPDPLLVSAVVVMRVVVATVNGVVVTMPVPGVASDTMALMSARHGVSREDGHIFAIKVGLAALPNDAVRVVLV